MPIISKEVICFFTSILFTNQLFDKRPHQSIFPKHDNFSRRLQLEGTTGLEIYDWDLGNWVQTELFSNELGRGFYFVFDKLFSKKVKLLN